ncbi:sulfite exporter TauE/SafE family protein [bacterium]|nr:sulfite exporter TauE/SafE family protein [bacterium]RQV94389.1 MAG: sulfite exporter TauE/SafE family protein [bacterium]
MTEGLKLLLLFVIGTLSSIINVNAGGGSSITLPALIFIGLESGIANGTNRIGILIQNLFAVSSFRNQNIYKFKESLFLAIFTLPGAIIGAILSIRINSQWFQRILAIVMIGIVLTILFTHSSSKFKQISSKKKKNWLIYPALLGIGFYGGFIQIGVGFLLMASLFHLLKIDLIQVNMHKVFIICLYTLPALTVFIVTGNLNWKYGCMLASGMALGGWIGARIAIKGGDKVIRIILAVAILLMALKLLGLF